MMTREEKLYAMSGATLIVIADKLGIKVKCNRSRSGLKEAKSAVIERILAAEKAAEENTPEEKEEITPTPPAELEPEETWEDNSYDERQEKAAESDKTAEDTVNKKKAENKGSKPGRGAQLEFDGRSQNICAWAKELGISANTLYGRIYRMGWSIEKAFTTPGRS